MNTLITRYSSTLLPLAVAVLGILEAARAAGTGTLLDWQTLTQIGLLLVGTGVVYWLPLVTTRWQGAFKTGAAIAFAVISAVVAVAPDGHFTKANAILVLTAIVKAVATQLGVSIRVDAAKTDAATQLQPAQYEPSGVDYRVQIEQDGGSDRAADALVALRSEQGRRAPKVQ